MTANPYHTQPLRIASGIACALLFAVATSPPSVDAVRLDQAGELRFGMRSYVGTRIGTEDTDRSVNAQGQVTSETFPFSAAGHVRQNRYYVEAELDHNLSRLYAEGWGPLELLKYLPFHINGLKYHLTFRGEADTLYDWGPREYSTAEQFKTLPANPVTGEPLNVLAARRHLRKLGTDRERLFQAYVEASVGRLFARLGRQVWSWGETDGFRLLDQINPLDSSFGGFLVSLDERRVPLDMLRLEYRVGELGPLSEMGVQGYAAIDNKVGFAPGIPQGSPWTPPNVGAPRAGSRAIQITPRRTFNDVRGGARLVWNMLDATWSIGHYYTYFDLAAVQIELPPGLPTVPFPDGSAVHGIATAPRVQVSGGTTSFEIPQLSTVVRSELAYFRDEPRYLQSQLDPLIFLFHNRKLTGGRRTGDSINYVLGLDARQYIRFLNPNQTFFISTQFFYKHLRHAVRRGEPGQFPTSPGVVEGEVLPVPEKFVPNPLAASLGGLEPSFSRQPTDQFLHTLAVATSYRSGTINPVLTIFYDWGGAFLYQPAVTFLRDPWRFTVSYSILDAGRLKAGSGVSFFRDRDNVLFQLEYAI